MLERFIPLRVLPQANRRVVGVLYSGCTINVSAFPQAGSPLKPGQHWRFVFPSMSNWATSAPWAVATQELSPAADITALRYGLGEGGRGNHFVAGVVKLTDGRYCVWPLSWRCLSAPKQSRCTVVYQPPALLLPPHHTFLVVGATGHV